MSRQRPYDVVFLGLSLSSSWGNGHATTFRALIEGLDRLGLRVLFLERNLPWYAENRDLPRPEYCDLRLYENLDQLRRSHAGAICDAAAVIVGSFVPDGAAVIDYVVKEARGVVGFYDIDTPVTLAKLAAGDESYLARRQVPSFDVYLSFTGGPTLDRLESEFGASRAMALYCSVAEQRYRPTGEAVSWDLGYLGTYSADRQPTLDRLLVEPACRSAALRFVVAGPQYPDDIAWPANVERMVHLAPDHHASFYSRQRFTLNVTRAAMVGSGWSPSVRLFEAAACGTPIISDDWPGLTDLFPEHDAVLIARTPDDVQAILHDVSEGERRRIAVNARTRVLAHHTGTARARELAACLGLTQDARPLAAAG
jgi:spore maturation protein CgeB